MYCLIHGRSHTSHKLGDKLLSREQRKQLEEFQSKLVARAEELGLPLAASKSLPAVKRRSREVVAKTFHKFGIVVPYDKEMELGYRPLPMTDSECIEICLCGACMDMYIH